MAGASHRGEAAARDRRAIDGKHAQAGPAEIRRQDQRVMTGPDDDGVVVAGEPRGHGRVGSPAGPAPRQRVPAGCWRAKNFSKNACLAALPATGMAAFLSPISIVTAGSSLTAGQRANPRPFGSPVLMKFAQYRRQRIGNPPVIVCERPIRHREGVHHVGHFRRVKGAVFLDVAQAARGPRSR